MKSLKFWKDWSFSGRMFALAFTGVAAQKIFATLMWGTDRALWELIPGFTVNQLGLGQPYGVLWRLTNPVLLGEFLYSVWSVVLDLSMLAFLLWLKKDGAPAIPRRVLLILQVLSVYYYMGYGVEHQNITVFIFIELMYLIPWAGAFAIAEKLPLGWSWNFHDSHVLCALTCNGESTHFSPQFWTNLLILNFQYVLLVYMFLIPLRARWKDAKKKEIVE
jgi:hypothetical protein